MAGLGRLFRATVAASLICATTTAAESQKHLGPDDKTATSANPFTDEFASFAKETLEDWKVPGVAIAVIDDDDIYAEVSAPTH
jgi:CubicO group peptidase (beta-lactamase class C family)